MSAKSNRCHSDKVKNAVCDHIRSRQALQEYTETHKHTHKHTDKDRETEIILKLVSNSSKNFTKIQS